VLRDSPRAAAARAQYGVALAIAGGPAEAVRAGDAAVAELRASRNGSDADHAAHQLLRIRLLAGQSERALDELEMLLRRPYHLTPARLGTDPDFDAVRDHPKFRARLGPARRRAAPRRRREALGGARR
jgi:hypothetical protein